MKNKNSLNEYKRSKILTAAPPELTLISYDGCIAFCGMAHDAILEKNYEKANLFIQKAEHIILDLQSNLNNDIPISKDFHIIYDYAMDKLIDANIHKDVEILDEAIEHIRDLRNIWVQIMEQQKGRRVV